HERPLKLDQLHLLTIQLTDDFRLPEIGKLRELIVEIDFIHVDLTKQIHDLTNLHESIRSIRADSCDSWMINRFAQVASRWRGERPARRFHPSCDRGLCRRAR